MLRDLRVSNLVLIREASLELAPGLNVLTGETGAGKTIVAQAVSLLLGGKTEAALVGPAGSEAYVEAAFANVPPELLPDGIAGLVPDDEDELLLARRVGADGRSRALVFGRSCARSDLEALGGGLLEIVSQHEARRLARPAVQLDLLDGAADASDAAGAHGGEPRGTRLRPSARSRRSRRRAASASARWRRCGALVDDADELGTAAGRGGRAARRARSPAPPRPAGRGRGCRRRARSTPRRAPARSRWPATRRTRSRARSSIDPGLAVPLADLQEAVARLQEAGVELRRYLQELEAQPGRLDQVESRLVQLADTARRHDAESADELVRPCRGGSCAARVARAGRPAGGSAARRAGDAPTPSCWPRLPRCTQLREATAGPFARAVESHLADLGMEHATLEVRISAREPGPRGADDVELLLQANPGLAAVPIARTASGGELSRIALAVRLAARDRSAGPTLVFDEVDAGVGGRTARALGEKLLRLSEHTQLLCITHLPQIAALAERHFRVVKTAGEPSETRIDALDGRRRDRGARAHARRRRRRPGRPRARGEPARELSARRGLLTLE